jgi:hypothetical protein
MSGPNLNDPEYWNAAVANYEAMAHSFTAHFAEAALATLHVGAGTRVLDVATAPARPRSRRHALPSPTR